MIMAGETTHAANTRSNYNANIVSTTQEEASDKLRTGDLLYSSIPEEFAYYGLKPVKYRNAEDALAFHMPPHTSTIISKPATSGIRGGHKDMYYDEAAFIKGFDALWQAGLPAITRGSGRATIVSTPMGQSGLFYELWKQPKFSHHKVPWWESRFMVKGAEEHSDPYNGPVAEAIALAPEMGTEERIERFASEKLGDIFHIGLKGDIIAFQTEYECLFVDEADSYFPWDLVLSGADDDLKVYKRWPMGYKPVGEVSIGVDLAKLRDKTVFTVVEHLPEKHKQVLYVEESMEDYDEQYKRLTELIRVTGARRVSIDETGVGKAFMEKVRRGEGGLVGINAEGVNFDQPKKEKWATQFKGDMQLGLIRYPRNLTLMDQIHRIKRTRTENGFLKFAGDKDDYFWSLMLALYGENRVPVTFHRL
jgi:hypothetical protein